jgi:uncharacterized membrane protein
MTNFSIVDPRDLAEFCKHQAQQGMGEAKRDAIEKQYAYALYAIAQGKDVIRIDGQMRIAYNQWLDL